MLYFVLSLVVLLPTEPGAGLRLDAYGDPLPPGAVARLGSVRWRCPDPPDHLIWSPDGKYLVGTHGGRSLTIWAYPSGVVTGRFRVPGFVDAEARLDTPYKSPPTLTPSQVWFAQDGRSMLIYGGRNQLFRVTVPDGQGTWSFAGDQDGVALAVSADGARRLLETNVVHGEKGRWSDLVLSDGSAGTRPVEVIAARRTHARSRLFGAGAAPHVATDVSLSSDGRFALAGLITEEHERLAAFDLVTGQRWDLGGTRVRPPALLPDGRAFLSHVRNGGLERWELVPAAGGGATRLVRTTVSPPQAEAPDPAATCVSPDGRHLVVGHPLESLGRDASEMRLTVHDARTLRVTKTWVVRVDHASLWDRAMRRPQLKDSPDFGNLGLAVAPDGRTLAVASLGAPVVRFFNLDTGTAILHHGDHQERVGHLTFAKAGTELVSLCADGVCRHWDLAPLVGESNRRPAGVRETRVSPGVQAAALPPRPENDRKLVYDPVRDRMQLRDNQTEDLIRELPDPVAGAPFQLEGEVPTALSTDGWWAAYRQGDRVVVHDQESGLRVAAFGAGESRPTVLEFVPGADLLATGYDDGQILLWRIRPLGASARSPTAAELDRAWADLGQDATAAVRGRAVFLARPADTVAWLKDRVRPIPHPTEYDIDLWLARLAHRRFAVREEAARLLARHFDVAEGPIREVLAVTRSPELQERLRRLLAAQPNGADAESVRLNRLVVILERLGTPAARELLFRIARGAGVPAGRATDALERLQSAKDTGRRTW